MVVVFVVVAFGLLAAARASGLARLSGSRSLVIEANGALLGLPVQISSVGWLGNSMKTSKSTNYAN